MKQSSSIIVKKANDWSTFAKVHHTILEIPLSRTSVLMRAGGEGGVFEGNNTAGLGSGGRESFSNVAVGSSSS